MIRERLQTSLLDDAQDAIARLTVENRRLLDTVSELESELNSARARLETCTACAPAEGSPTDAGSAGGRNSATIQVLQLQQELVQKDAELQVMAERHRHLHASVHTLETLLQDKRRSESAETRSFNELASDPHSRPLGTEAPNSPTRASQSRSMAEPSHALVEQVRRLQAEARHARESERNYARMVDALQQELLFTQRQMMKGRAEAHQTAARGKACAPPSSTLARPSCPSRSQMRDLQQRCQDTTRALGVAESRVSDLMDRCAAVAKCDADIITFLRLQLQERDEELLRLRRSARGQPFPV